MLGEQSARFAGGGVERENPAVLIVGRARDQKRLGARFIPDRRLQLNLAIAEAGVDPFHLAGRDVENRGTLFVLRLADVRVAVDVLRVRRFGDVIRHVFVLHAVRGFRDHRDDGLSIGSKFEAIRVLPGLQLERLALRPLILFALRFRFFADCLALLHGEDEIDLLLLEKFLAVGSFRGRGRRCSAASTAAATAAASSAGAGCGSGRRALGRRGANIGQLFQQAGVERHHIEIAAAHERDALFIERELRIRFRVGGLGDLALRAQRKIVNENVAVLRVGDAACDPWCGCRRPAGDFWFPLR